MNLQQLVNVGNFEKILSPNFEQTIKLYATNLYLIMN